MFRIGAGTVADVKALHFFAFQIDEVEAALGRVQAKVRDAHYVAFPDRLAGTVKFSSGQFDQSSVTHRAFLHLRKNARGRDQCRTACQSANQKITPFHRCGSIPQNRTKGEAI